MALFGNSEKKEQKREEKLKAIASKYHLEDINPKDLEAIKNINSELLGTGMLEFGTLLTGKAEDNVKISYLNTLIQQNWIIIRQLDEISKKLNQ